MSSHGRSIEEQFNLALGEALRDTTARWRASPSLILIEQTGTLSGHGNAGKRPTFWCWTITLLPSWSNALSTDRTPITML